MERMNKEYNKKADFDKADINEILDYVEERKESISFMNKV